MPAVRNISDVRGTGTSPTLSEPASMVVGDILIALAVCAPAGNIAKPTGWTDLYAVTSPTDFKAIVSLVRRGTSAPSLTWGLTGSVYREVFIVGVRPTAAGGPLFIEAQSASGSSGAAASLHNIDPPTVTALSIAPLAVAGGVWWSGSIAAWTASTGYTIRSSNVAADDGVIESKAVAAAGAENPSTITGGVNAADDFWDGFTVLIGELTIARARVMPQAVNRAAFY